jgi:tetratricopeptide (TPR) repeat protein
LAETVDATAATTAHCDYFLAFAETAATHLTGPDQGSWLARLDADHANLRKAARQAEACGDAALVLRFGAALDRYWNARFRQQEAFTLLAPVLNSPDADANPVLHANALITAAWAVIRIDRTASLRLAEQAVEIARRIGDDRLMVRSLAALCVGSGVAGDPEGVRLAGRESVELARRLGDDLLLGVSLHAYLAYADPAESEALYAEAIACTERTGDLLTNFKLHANLGLDALAAGDITGARAHLEAAAETADSLGVGTHPMSLNRGWVQLAEQNYDRAQSLFCEALRTNRRAGDNLGLAYSLLAMACLAAGQGNWRRAGTLHGAAQAQLDRTGNLWESYEDGVREESLRQVRAAIGSDQFNHALAAGQALGLEHAVGLALGRDPA